MAAGKLTHRVDLLAPRTQADAYGQPVPAPPAIVARVWGEVQPTGGVESRRGEQTVSETTHRVRIRYRRDFESTGMVRWRGAVLEVLAVFDDGGRGEYLILLCKESR